MTIQEYAKQEGITKEAAAYRAKHQRGVARKVAGRSPTGYVWDFKSNGHSNGAAATIAQAGSLLKVAEAFPAITVSQAISIARILDGKEAQ